MFCPDCGTNNKTSAKFCVKCGFDLSDVTGETTASAGKKDIEPGVFLDKRYEILGIIERGGMGAVYRATDLRLDIVCAVKEMRENFEREEYRIYAIEKFKDEALILSKLRHPNIPRVSDYFIENNRYYIVMDYIEGQTLFKIANKRPMKRLEEEELTGWVLQLCDVFSYLHHQDPPIIYRDVKPANIMINKENRVMLIDFGIARIFSPQSKGTMIGTQGYSPPEQYRGRVEPRSDIYALGATLHHLITGKDPQKDAPFSFQPVRQLRPDISERFGYVIDRCLKFNVADRFVNVEEIREYLTERVSLISLAPPPPPLEEDVQADKDKGNKKGAAKNKRGGVSLITDLENLLFSIEKDQNSGSLKETPKKPEPPQSPVETRHVLPVPTRIGTGVPGGSAELASLLATIPDTPSPSQELDRAKDSQPAGEMETGKKSGSLQPPPAARSMGSEMAGKPGSGTLSEKPAPERVNGARLAPPAKLEPPQEKQAKGVMDISGAGRTGQLFGELTESENLPSAELSQQAPSADKPVSPGSGAIGMPPKIAPAKPPFKSRHTMPFGPVEISANIPKITPAFKKITPPVQPVIKKSENGVSPADLPAVAPEPAPSPAAREMPAVQPAREMHIPPAPREVQTPPPAMPVDVPAAPRAGSYDEPAEEPVAFSEPSAKRESPMKFSDKSRKSSLKDRIAGRIEKKGASEQEEEMEQPAIEMPPPRQETPAPPRRASYASEPAYAEPDIPEVDDISIDDIPELLIDDEPAGPPPGTPAIGIRETPREVQESPGMKAPARMDMEARNARADAPVSKPEKRKTTMRGDLEFSNDEDSDSITLEAMPGMRSQGITLEAMPGMNFQPFTRSLESDFLSEEDEEEEERPREIFRAPRIPQHFQPQEKYRVSSWFMNRGNKTHTGKNLKAPASNGNLKWRFRSHGRVTASPVIGCDGTVYFGSNDGCVYAVSGDGREKWRYITDNGIFTAPLVLDGQGIYFGSEDNIFYALDFDGKELWRKQMGNGVYSSAVADKEGNIYVGCNDGILYAFKPDGEEYWRYTIDNFIYSSPALSHDGILYIGAWDKCMYAINTMGKLIWKFETGGIINVSPVLDGAGCLYFGSDDNYFYAIDHEGRLKWKFKTKDQIYSSPAIDVESGIFFGCNDTFVYNLSFDGHLRWRSRTNHWVRSSPCLDSAGNMYIGSDDFACYCFNSDGKVLWKFKTNQSIESSPAIDENGVLYFGSNDGWLYALE